MWTVVFFVYRKPGGRVCLQPNWTSAGKIVWASGERQKASKCAETFVWKVSKDSLPLSFAEWNFSEPNDEEHCLSFVPETNHGWNGVACDVAI